MEDLQDELRAIFGDERTLTDDADLFAYSRDATPGEMIPPVAVVRPASTADVSSLLALCTLTA